MGRKVRYELVLVRYFSYVQSRGGVVFCLTYASIIVIIIIVTDIYDIVIIINVISASLPWRSPLFSFYFYHFKSFCLFI